MPQTIAGNVKAGPDHFYELSIILRREDWLYDKLATAIREHF